MSSRGPSFELLRFEAMPAGAGVVLLEVEGRLTGRLVASQALRLVVERAGERRLELPAITREERSGAIVAVFAAPLGVLGDAALALDAGGVLLDLPEPDAVAGDRTVALARELNALRRTHTALEREHVLEREQASRREERGAAEVAVAERERDEARADSARRAVAAQEAANTALDAAAHEHAAALAEADQGHELVLAAVQQEHRTALAAVQQERQDVIAAVQQEHQAALAAAEPEHEAALANAQREHEAALADARGGREALELALAEARRAAEDFQARAAAAHAALGAELAAAREQAAAAEGRAVALQRALQAVQGEGAGVGAVEGDDASQRERGSVAVRSDGDLEAHVVDQRGEELAVTMVSTPRARAVAARLDEIPTVAVPDADTIAPSSAQPVQAFAPPAGGSAQTEEVDDLRDAEEESPFDPDDTGPVPLRRAPRPGEVRMQDADSDRTRSGRSSRRGGGRPQASGASADAASAELRRTIAWVGITVALVLIALAAIGLVR